MNRTAFRDRWPLLCSPSLEGGVGGGNAGVESGSSARATPPAPRLRRGGARIRRRGLTLYEVVLALAIFLGAMVVLSQIINVGARASTEAQLRTEAVLLCQTRMAEVVSGAVPMQTVSNQPYDIQSPNWQWSLDMQAGPHPDLLVLAVTVSYRQTDGRITESYTLTRYVRDPLLFQDAAAEAAAAEVVP
ncbi:MAG: hypothetical protein ACREJB_06745 [Planctomycetaceae bacterium]